MGRLSTTLCGIKLDNPVIPASGTFGFGYEFAKISLVCKNGRIRQLYKSGGDIKLHTIGHQQNDSRS